MIMRDTPAVPSDVRALAHNYAGRWCDFPLERRDLQGVFEQFARDLADRKARALSGPEGWVPNKNYQDEATWPPRGHPLYGLFHDARLYKGWQQERYENLIDWIVALATQGANPNDQ